MKVDFSKVLTDKKGEAIKDEEGDVTLGRVAEIALLASFADEAQSIDLAEKRKRFKIAMKIDGETDIAADENALIQKVIGKAFGPMIVGRACELLDG